MKQNKVSKHQNISSDTIEKLLRFVNNVYPGWTGFDDERYIKDEVDYKKDIIEYARDLLNREELERLLNQGEFEEIRKRIDKVGKHKYNNLLFRWEPSTGDLNILYQENLDKPEFCKMFFNLLYGDEPSYQSLDNYCRYVRKCGLPDKWTFPTFYLFMVHPDTEMFIKPSVFRWFLKSINQKYESNPSGKKYRQVLDVSEYLKKELKDYNPKDMVDIQSFIFIAHNGMKKEPSNRIYAPGKNVDHDEHKTRYWRITPGIKSGLWDDCLKGKYICFLWSGMGDLSNLTWDKFEKRRKDYQRHYPKEEATATKTLNQLWSFSHEIKQGDYIIATGGINEVLGIGRVTGEYYFVPDTESGIRWKQTESGALIQEFSMENTENKGGNVDIKKIYWYVWHAHRIPVEWFDLKKRSCKVSAGAFMIVEYDQHRFEEIKNAPIIDETPPPQKKGQPKYSIGDFSKETNFSPEIIKSWKQQLLRKKQIIFQGPPGTGKTYVAERLARLMISEKTGFYDVIQFHPAYAYEDFIQGIRPQTKDGKLTYQTAKGRFLDFCDRAKDDETDGSPCVMIIDEINRAHLARVFGELMYLLEYRDKEMSLAIGGETFRVPDNVYIIGTMNTADRSIALVDHALRRRFTFIRLQPDYDVLGKYLEKRGYPFDSLIKTLRKVNTAIDDKNYEIGISYFMIGEDNLIDTLPHIWRGEIEPYLEELFFDQPGKIKEFRWDYLIKNNLKDWNKTDEIS